MTKKITYSEAIVELEEIISGIENDEVNVDELTIKVKRAASLIKICKEKLHNTEEEIEAIIKEINS